MLAETLVEAARPCGLRPGIEAIPPTRVKTIPDAAMLVGESGESGESASG